MKPLNQFEDELFGKKVTFSERSTKNSFKQMKFSVESGIDSDLIHGISSAAMVISDSLEYFIANEIPFYLRWRYKRLFSVKNILRKLSMIQILHLSGRILKDLEGLDAGNTSDIKKKVLSNQLAG